MSASKQTTISLFFFLLGTIIASTHLLALKSLIFLGVITFLSIALPAVFSHKKPPTLVLGIAAFCLSLLWTTAWREYHHLPYQFGTTSTFKGVIIDAPDVRATHTFLTIAPLPSLSGGHILVTVDRYPLYHYGDILTLQGKLEEADVFNGFNYPLFLERFGIGGVIKQPQHVHKVGQTPVNPIKGALISIRLAVEAAINRDLPEPESSFLAGILLGSKRAIPDDVQAALKQTGTTHIIAISGANITITLALLLQFLPIKNLRSRFIAIVLISLFITVLTGASASVVRGAVIACLGSYLKLYSRRAWATPLILFSMCLMLLDSPLLLVADPGFQLSFAAFSGLAYTGNFVKSISENPWLQRIPEVMRGSLVETVSATLGTLPLSFKLFGQLSFLAFIVNPLILWLLPFITLLGMLLVTIGWIPFFASLIKIPLWAALHTVLGIIGFFALSPLGVWHWQANWLQTFAIYAVIFSLFLRLRHAHS